MVPDVPADVIYEIDAGRLHFRSPAASALKTLSLADLDFSCATPVQMVDVHDAEGGDIQSRLRGYTRDVNLDLIRASHSQTGFLRSLSEQELEQVAARPERGACVPASR